jgi:predicted molibdopterin-dependent oxidoreductase YjgC
MRHVTPTEIRDPKGILTRGRKIIVYYNDGNRNNRTYNVRAIVDENAIVLRNENDKNYTIEYRDYLRYLAEQGLLFV